MQVPTGWDSRLSQISLGSLKMLRVAGQVTAIQTGPLVGLLEPYTGGQKLQNFLKGNLVAYSDKEEPGRLYRDTLY